MFLDRLFSTREPTSGTAAAAPATPPSAQPVSAPVPEPGRALLPPDEHARRLLRILQSSETYLMTFMWVQAAYEKMCADQGLVQFTWTKVGRHFTPLTGGKRYRTIFNPRTGEYDAKERVYVIPAVGLVSKPVGKKKSKRKAAEIAMLPVRQPQGRAARAPACVPSLTRVA